MQHIKMYHVLNVVTKAATAWDLADCLLCGLSFKRIYRVLLAAAL
jgi:hypothetical protein